VRSTRALVLFARPPVTGAVKTRLTPAFAPAEARELYEAMLIDGIERLREGATEVATPFVLWSAECEPGADLTAALDGVSVGYQMGDDLGERMLTAFQDTLKAGFRQVVIIGSDAPHIPPDYIHQAFEAMIAVDVVLGPADDGGYYLIGCRRLHPRLFRGIRWGTGDVLAATRRRIEDGRISCHELPVWYDVDTPADAVRLWRDLESLRRGGDLSALPARTHRVLSRLVPGRLLPA